MYNSETAVYRAYSYYVGWNMIIMKQQLYRKDDEIVSHGASRMPNSKSNNWWCEAFRTKATSDGTTIELGTKLGSAALRHISLRW